MKSLSEHDAERLETYRQLNQPHGNGIACPTCGMELWDTNPTVVLASNPPRTSVHCNKCGFTGSRIV